ncbi:dTMP kinase [Candidatus Babeliales bacterium]|nr:dTMP kinase [Candidatus Babeliales bacterium]
MREYSGFLISIEGIDGSGKSTLAQSLAKALMEDNHPVILTKEPGQTRLGKKIRNILQQEKNLVCDKAEFLLFAADRAQHFEEVIIPGLKKSKIIISDRMADSSLAYQGYGRELNIELIKKINSWCMNSITPDLTLYVDIDEKTALERIFRRKQLLTAFEKESITFWKRVKAGFEEIFKGKNNVIKINGLQSQEEVFNEAYSSIIKAL